MKIKPNMVILQTKNEFKAHFFIKIIIFFDIKFKLLYTII